MALCIYFAVGGMSPDRYDEVQKALTAAGQGTPAGRSYHVAFKAGDDLHVVDVWDSMEQFEAFGETLMPLLAENGIDPGTPEIAEVYRVIVG
jgi:hypothetical protein